MQGYFVRQSQLRCEHRPTKAQALVIGIESQRADPAVDVGRQTVGMHPAQINEPVEAQSFLSAHEGAAADAERAKCNSDRAHQYSQLPRFARGSGLGRRSRPSWNSIEAG